MLATAAVDLVVPTFEEIVENRVLAASVHLALEDWSRCLAHKFLDYLLVYRVYTIYVIHFAIDYELSEGKEELPIVYVICVPGLEVVPNVFAIG